MLLLRTEDVFFFEGSFPDQRPDLFFDPYLSVTAALHCAGEAVRKYI